VVREGAAKAETVATATADGWHDVVELGSRDVTFHRIFAIWRRTPVEVVVVIDIRAIQ
jgi:hypothetical protein